MVNKFGANINVGASSLYKTNKNWVYGVAFSFLFGKNVKIDPVKNLKTAEGFEDN
jgi:hypothetical protein